VEGLGRHDRDVRPASCPTRRASKVIEYCAGLRSYINCENRMFLKLPTLLDQI
jgi:hypothetical protein